MTVIPDEVKHNKELYYLSN